MSAIKDGQDRIGIPAATAILPIKPLPSETEFYKDLIKGWDTAEKFYARELYALEEQNPETKHDWLIKSLKISKEMREEIEKLDWWKVLHLKVEEEVKKCTAADQFLPAVNDGGEKLSE